MSQSVVKLHAFSTLDEVTILAHKVESQRKAKRKRETLNHLKEPTVP